MVTAYTCPGRQSPPIARESTRRPRSRAYGCPLPHAAVKYASRMPWPRPWLVPCVPALPPASGSAVYVVAIFEPIRRVQAVDHSILRELVAISGCFIAVSAGPPGPGAEPSRRPSRRGKQKNQTTNERGTAGRDVPCVVVGGDRSCSCRFQRGFELRTSSLSSPIGTLSTHGQPAACSPWSSWPRPASRWSLASRRRPPIRSSWLDLSCIVALRSMPIQQATRSKPVPHLSCTAARRGAGRGSTAIPAARRTQLGDLAYSRPGRRPAGTSAAPRPSRRRRLRVETLSNEGGRASLAQVIGPPRAGSADGGHRGPSVAAL